jgi:hypothetical protein
MSGARFTSYLVILNNKLEWSLQYRQEKFGEQAGGQIIQTKSKFVHNNLVYSRYNTSNFIILIERQSSCHCFKKNNTSNLFIR